jgi:hypothetical protein
MLVALLVAAAAVASCRVEAARYTLRGAPDVTAHFVDVDSGRDWPAQLALTINFAKSGRAYWFLPWVGGTDDLQHLAFTTDVSLPDWRPPSPDGGPRPYGNVDYIATDKAYRVLDETPRRRSIAPAHILIPNLGDRTWHAHFDAAPKQFFDLADCAGGK